LSVVWPQNHWDDFSSVWASKLMATVCEWFGLKITRTVFTGLASKPVLTVSGGLFSTPAATISGGLASKHAATVSHGLASKPAVTVSSGLASKLVVTVSCGLASKPAMTVSQFGPQNRQLRFGDLGLKITATVCRFESQNQAGFSLSVASQNRWREFDVGHTSRSSDLLHVESSQDRGFQCGLKTNGGAMAGGARGIIVELVSSPS
jgi:hypothetical protein